jgi:16S rRNA (guanine966-N2)-methyltransferase
LRITGGECRGRIIEAPDGLDVRPTASKIRQAFFNILSNIVDGAAFVDVCAGSGLMGLEALSRGAASLIAIEENRSMVKIIQANIKKLEFGEQAEVIAADAKKALPLLKAREADIIFADPPYKSQLAEPILKIVASQGLLTDHGVLAIEHAADQRLPEKLENLVNYDRRKYGQTAVSFFRRDK